MNVLSVRDVRHDFVIMAEWMYSHDFFSCKRRCCDANGDYVIANKFCRITHMEKSLQTLSISLSKSRSILIFSLSLSLSLLSLYLFHLSSSHKSLFSSIHHHGCSWVSRLVFKLLANFTMNRLLYLKMTWVSIFKILSLILSLKLLDDGPGPGEVHSCGEVNLCTFCGHFSPLVGDSDCGFSLSPSLSTITY